MGHYTIKDIARTVNPMFDELARSVT